MRSKYLVLLVIFCLPLFAFTAPSAADDQERMMIKIPHAFTAGDLSLPAGRYSVSCKSGESATLHLHDTSGAACAHLPVITRLARETHHDAEARLVFDRVGGSHVLSEVWLSGEDGYLVRGTPKKHSHEVIHFGS